MNDIRQAVVTILAQAKSIIPSELPPDLQPMADNPDVPQWHPFEWTLWDLGEQIRHLLNEQPPLRADHQLQDAYVSIVRDRRAKRGRQSFLFLLQYKSCARCAKAISSELADPFTAGHVIKTLSRMAVGDFVAEVRPFANDPTTWIRNEARKYVARFGKGA